MFHVVILCDYMFIDLWDTGLLQKCSVVKILLVDMNLMINIIVVLNSSVTCLSRI